MKEVIIDGVYYVPKERTLEGEPKFKVGQWAIRTNTCGDPIPSNPHLKDKVFRITDIDDITDTLKEGVFGHMPESCRLATPAEIESHLRKICDEKYVGKKVKSLYSSHKETIHDFAAYLHDCDSLWYQGDKYGIEVYSKGKWAEIVPDKKKLPKTREEFEQMKYDWMMHPNHNYSEFLDQYDFED